ncbi:hypothetical protein CBR_g40701 [Chara braunii]|uniref:Uncharacterized protein n=1 Tax=Chara braunii TaxID=69332 RepID=A0A388LUF4_CHABU|nr:hypothetical protein CBR_g40701 [Chara braunii]|eukprot:GBG85889.1 hypothetical protein CBR_g40701 [Chara braunii]
MIAIWAAELYLDKINRLSLKEHGREGTLKVAGEGAQLNKPTNGEYARTVAAFRDFLSDLKDVLDEATTVNLLASYGRTEELVHFASLKEHHETVIQHYIQRAEAKKALAVLRKPSVSPELQYKFGPSLISLDPYETVEAWISAGSNLNPRRLIPALMRYASTPQPP